MKVSAIVAIGMANQIGLDNKLPWKATDDLRHFKRMTLGKTLIVGYNTNKDLPRLDGRTIVIDDRNKSPLEIMAELDGVAEIIIAGGAKTYQKWAPFITEWHISHINYSGKADTFFNPTWVYPHAKVHDYNFRCNN